MLSVNPWSTRLINDFSGIHAISVPVRQRPFCEWKMKSAKKTRTFEHSCLHWRPPLWKIKFINSINVLKIEQVGYNIRMEFPFGNTKIIKWRKHKRKSVTLFFDFHCTSKVPDLDGPAIEADCRLINGPWNPGWQRNSRIESFWMRWEHTRFWDFQQ